MKVLIINTTIEDGCRSHSLNGIDSAITFELYQYKNHMFHLSANHVWSKYTFYDEKDNYIGTFDSMDKLLTKQPFLGNVLIVTHKQWLDKVHPGWESHPRYQY